MLRAKRAHNLIAMNVGTTLSIQLRDRDCEVYPSDRRVKVSPTGLYTYPDASVVCDHPEFEDKVGDVLLNPQVLIEVLSDSTEAYDRGAKFEQYRQIASLRDYVLIAQNRMFVEHSLRQPTGSWLPERVQAVRRRGKARIDRLPTAAGGVVSKGQIRRRRVRQRCEAFSGAKPQRFA